MWARQEAQLPSDKLLVWELNNRGLGSCCSSHTTLVKWDHQAHSSKLKAKREMFSPSPPQFSLTNHSLLLPSLYPPLPAYITLHVSICSPACLHNSSNHSAASPQHQRHIPPVQGHGHSGKYCPSLGLPSG